MGVAARLRQSVADWVFRIRVPETPPVSLVQRRVYILPTRQGLFFASVLGVLLVGSINYALALGYLLTFLLGAMGFVALHHTWRNLAYLRLRPGRSEPVFAGGAAHFSLSLESPSGRARYAIAVRQARGAASTVVDVARGQITDATLVAEASRRGRLRCGRLELATTYPVGLFRAWAYVDFGQSVLVYPSPAPAAGEPPTLSRTEGNAAAVGIPGEGEFHLLRAYRPGDSPKHVAWRAFARGQPLQTREFQSFAASELWLDFADAPGANGEARLSILCAWVLRAEARGQHYGLRLPGVQIAPGCGELHRLACLEALALWGVKDSA